MNLDQVREMRSRMDEIETLEKSGRFSESDLIWDEMLKMASSGGMTRQAFVEAGPLSKLFRWMLPMWREEAGGASRFVNPGRNIGNALRDVKAPFWQNEVKIPLPDAWKHLESRGVDPYGMIENRGNREFLKGLMKKGGFTNFKKREALREMGLSDTEISRMFMLMNDTETSEEAALKMIMRERGIEQAGQDSAVRAYNDKIGDISDKLNIDEALRYMKQEGRGDYADRMIYAPGGAQRLGKGLVRNVAAPIAGYEALKGSLGMDRYEGGPTPDSPFDPRLPGTRPTRYQGYPIDPRYGGGYPSYQPYEPSGYQYSPEEETPFVPQWDQGSVSGVTMDPYGRRVVNTIPSYGSTS